MNREEAIKWLKAIEKKYIHGGDEEYDNLRKIALHMAMESLKQPTQSNASNVLNALDCVSKQAVIKAVDKHTFDTDEGLCLDDDISCILEEIPSAQPERKTGRWILWNYPGEECAICSVCGEEYDQMELYIGGNDYPKYCPDCGAKMEVEG